MMVRKCYLRPECLVLCFEDEGPLLSGSFDYVDNNGFIQVVNGEGVKPEQGL